MEPAMIALFTDFGLSGPYTGQVKAVLHQIAPAVPVVDLFADLPAGKPKPAAYLLAAYGPWFPPGTVLVAVVDPGVGGSRAAVVVEADGRLYVGPDNAVPAPPAPPRSCGAPTSCRQVFMGATCSPRWRRGSPGARSRWAP
jgi:S-adenosylmethionine hydrolase